MILSVANSAGPRNIESKKVSGLYPEGLRDSSSTLISFIERYYEHINTVGLPSYEISNITSDKDIDIASDKYLTNIQSLIAKTIPNTSSLDKVLLYKIVLQYYNSRGSEDSIYAFFKLFYDEVVSIFYPKDYLFDLSAGSGRWELIDYNLVSKCLTNPNKTRMVVSSDSPIGPKGEMIVYLEYLRDNIWSYVDDNGITLDPDIVGNIPFIERYSNPYNSVIQNGWIFRYDYLENITTVDAPYPDEATWGVMQNALHYDEKSIEYIDESYSKTFVYQRSFSIHSEGTPTSNYGDIIRDTVNNLTYYSIEVNPVHWDLYTDPKRWNHSSHRSFASDNYKLHDGHYWQKYSYEIKSTQSSDVWINDYLRFVHPAGLKLFSAILLQLLAKSQWYTPIDYINNFVNVLRPPSIGYHTPTYQPGWLNSKETIFAVISLAISRSTDPAMTNMLLTSLGLLLESSNSRNSIVRNDYQTWSKNIDSTQLSSGYVYKTIGQAMETYSNSNVCNFNNISSYVDIDLLQIPYFLSSTNTIRSFPYSSYDDDLIDSDIDTLSAGWDYGQVIEVGALSNLVLNNAELTPKFSTGNTTYTSIVTNDIEPITIVPTSSNSGDVITINGVVIKSGTTSDRIQLDIGDNIIDITITSIDSIVTTYTITITAVSSSQALTLIYNDGSSIDYSGVTSIDSYLTGNLTEVNTIFLGAGVYTVNGGITVAQPVTIAARIGRTATIKMINAPWSQSVLINCIGVTLRGIVIDVNSVSNIEAHYPTYFSGPVLSRIEGPEYRCLIMHGGIVDNCHFINWTTGGIGEVFPIWGFDSTFSNILIDNPVSVGPGEPYVTIVAGERLHCDNISIILPDAWNPWLVWNGLDINSNRYPKTFGFTLYDHSSITNCYVKNCTNLYHNDSFDINDVSIINNTSDHLLQGFASWGYNHRNVLIDGNTFNISPYMNGSTIGWSGYGILVSIENNPTWDCTNLKIVNNTLNMMNTGIMATPLLLLGNNMNTPEVHDNIVTGATTRGSRFHNSNVNITGSQDDFESSI